MTPRGRALLVVLILITAGVGITAVGYGPFAPPSGDLQPVWTSDTVRDTGINHHPIGASHDGDLILAPVAVPASPHNEQESPSADTSHADHGHDHSHQHTTRAASTPGTCQLVSLDRTGHSEWAYTVPQANCSAHAVTQPAIGNLTGNATPEIAFSTTERAVIVLTADGAERYRVPLDSYGYGQPTIANVTDAPGNELIASDIRGSIIVAAGEEIAWTASLSGTVYPSPVVADIDADGVSEVLVATSQSVVAFESTGERAWTRNVSGWTLATGDIDDDSATEVFATGTTEIVALDGYNGETQWTRSFESTPNTRRVVDGDGDGDEELYVTLNGGRLLALDARTSETEWEAQIPTNGDRLTPQPVIGDLTGDGSLEVVGVTNDGGVAVVDAETGTRRATYTIEANIWTHATLTDLDRDGDSEILLRLGDGRVQALEYTE